MPYFSWADYNIQTPHVVWENTVKAGLCIHTYTHTHIHTYTHTHTHTHPPTHTHTHTPLNTLNRTLHSQQLQLKI